MVLLTLDRAVIIPHCEVRLLAATEGLECFGLQVMSSGFVLGDTDTVIVDAGFAGRMLRQTLTGGL